MDELIEDVVENQSDDIYIKLAEKRVLFLSGDITPASSTELIANLLFLDKKSKKEIKLFINSTGGDVAGCFAIVDLIKYISSPVSTVVLADAASSAAVILSSGTRGKRFALPNSTIMIHSVSAALDGNQKELEEESKRVKKINKKMVEILSQNTKQLSKKISRDIKKDKYFTPEQAKAYGLIDEIL